MNKNKINNMILNKIKEYYNFKTNTEFANFLGIPPTTLSSWYSRNTMDYHLIYAKCKDIDANWLLTGEGEMLRQGVGGAAPAARPPEAPAQELEALRREVQLLRKLVDTLEATVAAKDTIIGQLQRALDRLERER